MLCDSVTQSSKHLAENLLKKVQILEWRWTNFTVVRKVLHDNQWSHNLIGPYHFLVISQRNSTLFTRPFLTGRCTQGRHVTKMGKRKAEGVPIFINFYWYLLSGVWQSNIWCLSWTATHIVHFSDITQKLLLHDHIIVNRQCKYLYLTLLLTNPLINLLVYK